MTIIVRDETNTPRTITAIQVRDGGNVARNLSEVRVRDSNNVSRQVFTTGAALSVSIAPEAVFGVSYGTGICITNTATATPAGGTAPYTYAWSVLSHSNATPPTINSPTTSGTKFTQPGVPTFDDAVFECVVTDDLGATASDTVLAYFENVP